MGTLVSDHDQAVEVHLVAVLQLEAGEATLERREHAVGVEVRTDQPQPLQRGQQPHLR